MDVAKGKPEWLGKPPNEEEKKLEDMRSVWEWARKLRGLRHQPTEKRESGLLEQCEEGRKLSVSKDREFLFPSKATEKIAERFEKSVKEKRNGEAVNLAKYDLPFQVQKHDTFPLYELLEYVCDNKSCVTEKNSAGLFVMLIDTVLYWVYRVVSKLACGRLLFQLNACIVLDAMILKPDGVTGKSGNEMKELLRTVVKKTQNQVDSLDKDIIWAIAMLSYKTQRYGRARYYFDSYLRFMQSPAPLLDNEKRVNACIYIGYCFEKRMKHANHFTQAIDWFERLLETLEKEGEDVREQAVQSFRKLYEDKRFKLPPDFASALEFLEEKRTSAEEFAAQFDLLIAMLEKKRTKSFQEETALFKAQQEKLKRLDDYLVEIHHGLGHFYNERAVFGDSKNDDFRAPKDLIHARSHMWIAMQKRPADFASCYGSLFHEYEDYRAALNIFEDAEKDPVLENDPELKHELEFYIAQTKTLMSDGENQDAKKKDTKDAKEKFTAFEHYCEDTFNFDGIIHARIFQARAYLRTIPFSAKKPFREETKREILSHYDSLTEYSLSNYASESIRNEYEKTRFMLSVYRSLYWGEEFSWSMADVQYGLENFLKHMPENVDSLGFEDTLKSRKDPNLYIANIPYDFLEDTPMRAMQIWCVAENPFPSELLRKNGGLVDNPIPVNDVDKAYLSMESNGHTIYVAVIPPKNPSGQETQETSVIVADETQKDADYQFKRLEHEIQSLKDYFRKAHMDLRFLLPPVEGEGNIHNLWLKDALSRERTIAAIDVKSDLEALQYAFCFQALSILRNELLQPMPLFTLVPTHLSTSFTFQSGQSLNLLSEDLLKTDRTNPAMLHSRLREVYQQTVVPPNRNAFERRSGRQEVSENGMLPCASKALMTICCPNPVNESADSYLSYQVTDFHMLKNDGIQFARSLSNEIDSSSVYDIKALPNYASLYFRLLDALEQCENCTDTTCQAYRKDECNLYCTESSIRRQDSTEALIRRQDSIKGTCLELLRTLIIEPERIQRGYKCVLRQSVQDDAQAIFIMLVREDDANLINAMGNVNDQNPYETEPQSEKTTIGISYSWEEIPEYNKEVSEFKAELERRLGDGYQVILDREINKQYHDWHDTTTHLMTHSDKIIVLLSEGYKKKADSTDPSSGVYIESRAIASDMKTQSKDIIFVVLASNNDVPPEDLTPVYFRSKNINYLAKENLMAGHGMEALLARIRGEA